MVLNTERFEIISEIAEGLERVDEGEAERQDKAEQGGDDKRHNLVVGDAGGEKSHRNERRAEEEQSEIGAPSAAHVDVAHWIADPINGDHINQRGKQRDDQQREASEELGPHNLHVGQRQREQVVHRARAFFLREGAHRDGRHQKEEQKLRKVEKSL